MRVRRVLTGGLVLWLALCGAVRAGDHAGARAELLREVQGEIGELAPVLGRQSLSAAVREALGSVPREEFVPPRLRDQAYENRPLSIGYGQTISQPLIVALMSELLEVDPGDIVFELGTGSGYQAAVLAAMGARVYSMEIVEPLAKAATQRLRRLGYRDVQVRVGDGYYGWPEAGAFDAIIVTAASDHIPPPLTRQLKPGGRMVIPVGDRYLTQQLLLVTRGEDEALQIRSVLPVLFVPLTGGH